MGAVREVYNRLVRVTRCKNCGNNLNSKVTTCESGHIVCETCYGQLDYCTKCHGEFFARNHVFYNNVLASLNDKTDFLGSLFEILECPVCYELLTYPSWSCWNGHVTCGRCYYYTSSCPLCREEFTDYFNTDINALLKILESPIECINKLYGCDYRGKYSKLKRHEMKCKFRQYKCLMDGCEFSGFLNNLSRHINDNHQKQSLKPDRSCCVEFKLTSERTVRVVSLDSEHYWLISLFQNGEVKISVFYIGFTPKLRTGSLSLLNKTFTVPISAVTTVNEPNSVYSVIVDSDSRIIEKDVWCNLVLNSNKSSWFIDTMFFAVLAVNLTIAIVLLK